MREALKRRLEWAILRSRAWRAGRAVDESYLGARLQGASLILVSVMKDDCLRLPFWLDYYRALGVDHFLIVNNDSNDGTDAFLAPQQDVSVIPARGSYKQSHYGVDWINYVLTRHCRGKWILCVDSDEFLTYDGIAQRPIPELIQLLQSRGVDSLQCLLLDLYSDRDVASNVVPAGEDPLRVCALYDSTGYRSVHDVKTRTTWVKGGVRERVFFTSDPGGSPALNKTPLVRWSWTAMYAQSTHRMVPARLNAASAAVGITAILLHQKFLSLNGEKAADPAHRAEHHGEYEQYGQFATTRNITSDRTHEYAEPADLIADGLMSAIHWNGVGS